MARELEATAPLPLRERRQTTLTALWEGGGTTRFVGTGGPVVVGRGAGVEVDLEHASLSRRHAVLHIADTLEVEDLGSANGTRVRGRSLRAGERVGIGWGEPIELGAVVVLLRPADGSFATPKVSAAEPPSPRHGMGIDEVEHLVSLAAPTDISVLLLGETGVGKGYFAQRIHAQSKRSAGPWLHLNCAALPENLLESELFGYERGAFTGATQAKPGLLESASSGTVFLDEVGDLPLATQGKLLIALERREVMRIGALKPRPFDVRFISATNRALEEQAERGLYRADLYYRLAGLPITIPPLRERRGEITRLASLFLQQSCHKLGRKEPMLSAAALETLLSFDWPGNVRQLGTVIERALLWCKDVLGPEQLMLSRSASSAGAAALASADRAVAPPPPPPAPLPGAASVAAPPAAARSLKAEVDEVERRRITEALEACGGNQVRAAELLGISRRTLINRMISYGMPRPRKG